MISLSVTQRLANLSAGGKEKAEHLIVECVTFKEDRRQLKEEVVGIGGEEEMVKETRIGRQRDYTVSDLYRERKEADQILKYMKRFLVHSWEIKDRD